MSTTRTPNSTLDLITAIDYIPQGLGVFDSDGRLQLSNARYQKLLGLEDRLVVPGTSISDIVQFLADRGDLGGGDPAEVARSRIEGLMKKSQTISQRLGVTGQQLEIQSSQLEEGGIVVSLMDVTDRADAEAALASVNLSLERRVEERTSALSRVNTELELARTKADAANQDKTRFFAAASHDLLQPLNAARLYTSTLIEKAKTTEFSELAESIDASLGAVEEIMSVLLDISRIESGALKPSPSTFNISELMAKIDVEFQPLARERNIQLKVLDIDCAVFTDRMLLSRVVQNLVSNAIKYTLPGGSVLVGCRRRGGRLRFDVIDTGIGISKGQQSLIFKEFARLEHGARIAQGIGLGLSIVQRISLALGLALELESVVGKGSRFSVHLPVARLGRRKLTSPEPEISQPEQTLSGLRVLCVDNEVAILDAMRGLMEGWACDVRTARSLRDIAQSALLDQWMPDIVLMDYHLDQSSGLDAIEWLRQNVGGHLPAALVTADRNARVSALAEERGIPILTKPVKPGALRAVLSRLNQKPLP